MELFVYLDRSIPNYCYILLTINSRVLRDIYIFALGKPIVKNITETLCYLITEVLSKVLLYFWELVLY